jgi:hypothetical protein
MSKPARIWVLVVGVIVVLGISCRTELRGSHQRPSRRDHWYYCRGKQYYPGPKLC